LASSLTLWDVIVKGFSLYDDDDNNDDDDGGGGLNYKFI